MSYLNVDLDYFHHPKTKRLVYLLGRGAELIPIRLWAYCGKYHYENGEMTGYSGKEIEALAEWWGKPGEMLEAMLKVCFMECDGSGTYRMHDWQEHQGHIAALKERGKAAANARWSKLKHAASNAGGNAASITISNAPAVPAVPSILVKEESSGAEAPSSPRGKRVPKLCDDDWLISLEQDEVYRGIEIRSELAKAKRWCEVNGRPCSRRFFVNWINRARPILPSQPDKMAGQAISVAANGNPINGHGSTFTLQKQLELVNQELKAIHARGFEDALIWQPANESDRQAIQKLKAQRNELKIKLGLK